MLAAQYSENPEILSALLRAGADLNAKNKVGKTPLMYAAQYSKNPEVIKALLEAGAEVNTKDKKERRHLCGLLNTTKILRQLRRF